MRIPLLLAAFFVALACGLQADDSKPIFHQGDFESLKHRAAQEGKYCLIEFYTEHCATCVRLEKQTFSNTDFLSFVNKNFVAYRADGLSFADGGYDLAKKYHIRAYPTVLILNAKGQVLRTLEGFFLPRVLQSELQHLDEEISPMGLFKPSEVAIKAESEATVVKRVIPEASKKKNFGASPKLFYSEFGLEVWEFNSYGEAQDAVRVWDIPWKGDIWLIPASGGNYKIVLGPLDNKKEAEAARQQLMEKHDMETRLLDFSELF